MAAAHFGQYVEMACQVVSGAGDGSALPAQNAPGGAAGASDHRVPTSTTWPQRDDPSSWAAAIVAGAGDAIMAVDPEGRIVVWNDGCEELFGWTAAEMTGRSPDVLLPADRAHEAEGVVTPAAFPESAVVETVRIHKSGAALAVSCRTSTMRDPEGRVLGAAASYRDITLGAALRNQLEQARNLAEARFRQSVVPQSTLTPEGVVIDVNPALCSLSGYEPSQLLGRPVTDFMAGLESAATWARCLARAAGPSLTDHVLLLRHADGRLLPTRISAFPLRDEATGEVLRLEAMVEDISGAAAAVESQLQLRERRWQSLLANCADVAFFCTRSGEVLFVGPSITAQFGHRPEEVLAAPSCTLWHPDDRESMTAAWQAATAAPTGTTSCYTGRARHADGSWRWVDMSMTNRLDDADVAAMVVNIRDISERRSSEAVLAELAGLDALTGLPTRALLMAALDAAFAAGHASRTAVAVIDLARFKLVNDSYGHRGGDAVLVEVAERLVAASARPGVVARIGGDRFALMFSDVGEVSELFEIVAALLDELARPIEIGEQTEVVTAVAGAAVGPAVDSGALLTSAESALQTAKIGLAGPMHILRAESSSASLSRARLVEDLRRGIDADEFVVHFQPIVSVSSGRPVAAEALVRWQHPGKGLLSPGAFMEAAEDSGFIVAIGEKVLAAACGAAARWAPLAGSAEPFHVAVNLSAQQLARPDVTDLVRRTLARTGAAPENLMLEVTESAVMADVDAAVSRLQELRSLGVGIAVDDFGTGYSSLTYLKQFPVTALKIDRSFVSGIGQDDEDAAIVSSVIGLARALHLECIAEGVETEQQRLILQALGCEQAQGFLWSPAVEAAALESWLRTADESMTRRGRVQSAARPFGPAAVVAQLSQGSAHETEPVFRRAADLRAAGASLATIAAALNAQQLLTQHRRRWSSRSVSLLLSKHDPQ